TSWAAKGTFEMSYQIPTARSSFPVHAPNRKSSGCVVGALGRERHPLGAGAHALVGGASLDAASLGEPASLGGVVPPPSVGGGDGKMRSARSFEGGVGAARVPSRVGSPLSSSSVREASADGSRQRWTAARDVRWLATFEVEPWTTAPLFL